MWPFLVFAAAVAVVLVVYGVLTAGKRRQALEAFAAARGLRFVYDPGEVHKGYEALALDPFGSGHGRRSSNLLAGRSDAGGVGVDWQLFDYRYKTGGGKD